jgi:hypothetical protein
MEDRNETISGLRQLADWLEAHPEVPVPTYNQSSVAVEAADLPTIARAMGQAEKTAYGDYFRLSKRFGGVEYYCYTDRDAVCTRTKVGTKVIPAQEARVVDVWEWDCNPVLALEGE